MQIDITDLIQRPDFSPWDLCNSVANLGANAGQITWRNAKAQANTPPPILATEEQKEAFRDFAKSSGGWTRAEIDAWDDTELRALFIQWVAGDIREGFGDVEPSELLGDSRETAALWEEYQSDAEAGRVSSRVFRCDVPDHPQFGRLFFDLSN